MQLLGNRWLAWTLRLVTDLALAVWLLLMAYVLFVTIQQRSPDGSGVRQGSVYSELTLPAEIVEVASPDISVFNFEASQVRIHYRTAEAGGFSSIARSVTGILVWWGIFALILWQLRHILSSFVRREPLTLQNAHRFRVITYLLVLDVVLTSLVRSLDYIRLQPLFPMLSQRGFIDLFLGHVAWSRLFTAMLVLLLAEAVRLGAEHRLDSEAVI